MPEAYTRKGIEMTKKEKELEHDRATYQMMMNVSRHADVQQTLFEARQALLKLKQEQADSGQGFYYLLAFCTGCFVTTALIMLKTWI